VERAILKADPRLLASIGKALPAFRAQVAHKRIAAAAVAAGWFDCGEKLTSEELQRLLRAVTTQITGALKGLGERPPTPESLRAALRKAMDEG
jgi:hypothetical protein